MRLPAIHRKLLRELWQLKTQILSIALVVATGVMTVVTMRGSYESLVAAQQDFYQQTRFADVWVNLRRAPETLQSRLTDIPGVAIAETRISFLATLDLEGLDAPATGRFVSLPELRRPALNDIQIRQGRYLEPGAPDEVIISEKFAQARGLRPGDQIRAIINGRARDLDIVGTAVSPEHIYAMPPGGIMPEDERYGVLWMGERALGPAYDRDGAFNEAFVRMTPGANPREVIDGLNNLLRPYGGFGAYPRRDQPSHMILQAELDQNRIMGTAIPAIFLAVAVFLLHLVLGRLIATQRGEIAVLKAFGYRDSEVGLHYLQFAMAAVLLGIVLGAAGGVMLGQGYIDLYGEYFELPGLTYRVSWPLLLTASLISLLGAATGAINAVLKAVRLPPAEAMRPEPPASFKAGWLESSGLTRLLPSSARMIIRNLERRPWQCLMSSMGIALSVAILVIGFFLFDGVRYLMDLQFREAQREDVSVNFHEQQSARVLHELWQLPGITQVEPWRSAPARIRHGHRYRDTAIQGMPPDGDLRRLVTTRGEIFRLPANGVVLSRLVAESLGVQTGDSVRVELLEGQRHERDVLVSGVVDDFMGLSAYMNQQALDELTGEPQLISGAYLLVADNDRASLYQRLKNMPMVAGVASPQEMLESFEVEMARSIFISVGFLVGFASVITVGVVYNGARIALSDRGRELASLRVIGFHRNEVAILLLGEQAIITLLAIPLGWGIGYGLSWLVVQSMETDMFRLPYVVNPETWMYSGIITLMAAAASGLAVRRRLDRFDLVSVLKTRE